MARMERNIYYEEGNTARITGNALAEPDRRVSEPEKKRNSSKKIQREVYTAAELEADRAKAFDAKYMLIILSMVAVMAAASIGMLLLQQKVVEKKASIETLQSDIRNQQTDNKQAENSLENMYTMEEIYQKATNELGMVYARDGQVKYYQINQDDYVKQYKDVSSSTN